MDNVFETIAKAYGFERELVGGGCIALSRYFAGGGSILITGGGGGHMPEGPAEDTEFLIGYYPTGIGEEDSHLTQGIGLSRYVRLIQAAIERAESGIPSLDTLADEYDGWLKQNGLPQECADALALRLADWSQWLADFSSRWREVQKREDFLAACAARGE